LEATEEGLISAPPHKAVCHGCRLTAFRKNALFDGGFRQKIANINNTKNSPTALVDKGLTRKNVHRSAPKLRAKKG
jgi:hypothetical protein